MRSLRSSEREAVAPEVGLEPTTNRLTADRSTTELLRIVMSRRDGGDLVAGAGFEPAAFRL